MANIIPLYWKWISSSCWCQEHHAPAFYSPLLGPSPPWVSSQLQTTNHMQTLGYALLIWHASSSKLLPLKSAPNYSCIVLYFALLHLWKGQAGTLLCQASWHTARRKLCSAELSVPCTLPQHSSVCTWTDGKAWSAKHSCSMSGICCLMSSSIKPSGRDESSKPVHQSRLLYSNSH